MVNEDAKNIVDEEIDDIPTEINGLPIDKIPEEMIHKPDSISGQIEILLFNGYSKEEIAEVGLSAGSTRTVASKMHSKYGIKFGESKTKKKLDDDNPKGTGLSTKVKSQKGSSSMEATLNSITFPEGNQEDIMSGVKFGMNLMAVSVRFVQELAATGIAQSKPLIELSRAMRDGEILAAKNASAEAARSAAQEVVGVVGPMLTSINDRQNAIESKLPLLTDGSSNSSSNPMRDMMMRAMQPHMEKAMSSMMGKVMGGNMFGGGSQQNSAPNIPTQSEGPWPIQDETEPIVKEAIRKQGQDDSCPWNITEEE